jgi:hypothetical protein
MKQHLPVIFFSVLAVVLLVYFLVNREEGNRFSWNESYKVTSDQPYGTIFIRDLLEKTSAGEFIVNDRKPVKQLFKNNLINAGTNYIFIGQSIHLDKEDRFQLMKFVESGNDAFISSLDAPTELANDMKVMQCDADLFYEPVFNASTVMNFFHDSIESPSGYRYTYRFGADTRTTTWPMLDNMLFCEDPGLLIPLGYHGDKHVNFIKIPFGKGNFYFHSNPVVFTNLFMISKENLPYTETALSFLQGDTFLWDEYSKIPYSLNKNNYDSPLYYILQQPSLKHAWWLLLITVALYVFFTAKRTQRIIPVLETKTNTTLEYIRHISALYYQNGDHLDMAHKKMKYFLYFIRSRYGIHTQEFTDHQIEKLSGRCGVPADDIRVIFNLNKSIAHATTHHISGPMLARFHEAIEHFYKHCK